MELGPCLVANTALGVPPALAPPPVPGRSPSSRGLPGPGTHPAPRRPGRAARKSLARRRGRAAGRRRGRPAPPRSAPPGPARTAPCGHCWVRPRLARPAVLQAWPGPARLRPAGVSRTITAVNYFMDYPVLVRTRWDREDPTPGPPQPQQSHRQPRAFARQMLLVGFIY